MNALAWSGTSVSECPGCGATVVVGIMSLAATCRCGMYYVDLAELHGWFYSIQHYVSGASPVPEFRNAREQDPGPRYRERFRVHCRWCGDASEGDTVTQAIQRVEKHEVEKHSAKKEATNV